MVFAAGVTIAHRAPPSQCVLLEANKLVHRFEGSCGWLFGQEPKLRLKPAHAITSGWWRRGATPNAVWAGDMTDQGYPNADIELEVYDKGAGVLRTAYGWFAVSGYNATTAALRFTVDTTRQVAPTDLDRDIIRRASAMLSSMETWNRVDNRRCPGRATAWSVYCALDRAAVEVACGTHHRRPAMEAVRVIVDERSADRNYEHRLMGYNNDSTTTLADVRSLFAEALRRLNASPTDPVPPPATCPPEVPQLPTRADVLIAERAAQLLGSSDKWNRQDQDTSSVDCPDSASTLSVRCALKRASNDVIGEFDGGGPLMREARQLVDSLATKKYNARLIDYNNDRDVSFEQLQAYFRILRERVAKKARG